MEDIFVLSALLEQNFDEEDSSNDDEILEDICAIVGPLGRTNIKREYCFVEVVLTRFSDEEFKQNFRMDKKAFNWIHNRIKNIIDKKSKYKANIRSEKQLLAAVWILSTPDSYRSIAGRFNMSKSSLFICFERVVKALNSICHDIIKWPGIEERQEIQQKFYSWGQIPGCVGAIDGTYIPIKAPAKNAEVYINRKCFHGITLQAICDHRRAFIDIFCGYPSSVSDNIIFRNSKIFKNIVQHRGAYFNENEFIIGDKAYPLYRWCVTPYIDRGILPPHQIQFNKRHAQTRQVIERAFALLFGRFRRLKYIDMTKTEFIPQTVQAACILHNVCLMHNDDQQHEEEGLRFLNDRINGVEDNMEVPHVENANAAEFRDELARQ